MPATPRAAAKRMALALLLGVLLAACGGTKAITHAHRHATRAPAGRPWRVVILGDSIENEVAPRLTELLKAAGVSHVYSRTFSGESFCSAWANHGRRVLAYHPDLILIEGEGLAFSACSKQPPYPAVANDQGAWQQALAKDLRDAIFVLRQGGPVQVLLDAGPKAEPIRPYQERTRATYAALARRYPGYVTALDVQSVVLDPRGRYVDELPCTGLERRNGRCAHAPDAKAGMIRVRAYDRRHFCLTPSTATWPEPGCSTYSSGIERYARAQELAVLEHLKR